MLLVMFFNFKNLIHASDIFDDTGYFPEKPIDIEPKLSPQMYIMEFFKNFINFFAIPIILCLCLKLYWEKSKRRKEEKIVISIIFVVLAAFLETLFLLLIYMNK